MPMPQDIVVLWLAKDLPVTATEASKETAMVKVKGRIFLVVRPTKGIPVCVCVSVEIDDAVASRYRQDGVDANIIIYRYWDDDI